MMSFDTLYYLDGKIICDIFSIIAENQSQFFFKNQRLHLKKITATLQFPRNPTLIQPNKNKHIGTLFTLPRI